jgi:trimethylamine--corrinoid protein Co-methyltransferase
MDPHTLRHMRAEYFYPAVADRQNRAAWEAAGKLDTRARAAARAASLLRDHEPAGLPAEVDRAVRARFQIFP